MHPFFAHTPAYPEGKWHDLVEHSRAVAAQARVFAAAFGGSEWAWWAGLWHDLGKFNPDFQAYLKACNVGRSIPKGSVPHAIHGAIFAQEMGLEVLSLLIAGHHAGIPAPATLRSGIARELQQGTYKAIQHKTSQYNWLRPQGVPAQPPQLGTPLGCELFLRMVFSALVDADFLDTEAHFEQAKADTRRVTWASIPDLWARLEAAQNQRPQPHKSVNRIRQEVYQACLETATQAPGVFRLTVPTGCGKTLSSLSFALRHAHLKGLRRVVYAIPYTSIVEQTADVFRAVLGADALIEHHSAARTEIDDRFENADLLTYRARLATENWDAPLIVTTTVQLFESLFDHKPRRCRKLHNLAGSVIVLDEVQTLPVHLLGPICDMLQQLALQYGVSVVLCTATQPALENQSRYLQGFAEGTVRDIIPPDQIARHFEALRRVRYVLPTQPWTWANLAEQVQQEAQALVILNTRRDALALMQALGPNEQPACDGYPGDAVRASLPDAPVLHLSTLLCGVHRRQVLAEVKRRLREHIPLHLVSTQVVEAGVDVDFPTVFRARGPLDRIVQAAGRCNREGERKAKGRVVVFAPAEGGLPRGEYKTAADIARTHLAHPDLNLHAPDIFRSYFNELYRSVGTDREQIQELRQALDFPEVAARFRLIKDETVPFVVCYDSAADQLVRRIRATGVMAGDHRRLQPYLVSVFLSEARAVMNIAEEIAPGIRLWPGGYDPLRGLTNMALGPEDLFF